MEDSLWTGLGLHWDRAWENLVGQRLSRKLLSRASRAGQPPLHCCPKHGGAHRPTASGTGQTASPRVEWLYSSICFLRFVVSVTVLIPPLTFVPDSLNVPLWLPLKTKVASIGEDGIPLCENKMSFPGNKMYNLTVAGLGFGVFIFLPFHLPDSLTGKHWQLVNCNEESGYIK